MYNYNGQIAKSISLDIENNRAFLYGDAVFETIKVSSGKILFLEDHYFRLMSSMRILRMEIPMEFTMEYFDQEIQKLLSSFTKTDSNSYRIRITVFRESAGLYAPLSKNVHYLMHVKELDTVLYPNNFNGDYEVELFKDYSINPQLLSTLKSTNRMIQITASIFANENGYNNCLILNTDKNVAEAIDANLFMVIGKTIVTPPITDGCVAGILRKELLRLLSKNENYILEERSISAFELQKADELFLTNTIKGIQPITKYRKKVFFTKVGLELFTLLNESLEN